MRHHKIKLIFTAASNFIEGFFTYDAGSKPFEREEIKKFATVSGTKSSMDIDQVNNIQGSLVDSDERDFDAKKSDETSDDDSGSVCSLRFI